ncbi:MAG: hypothetical protein M3041_06350 [Acidobacteriota bacterium]|nr:hypothetical protein [Acidobacteriota bacterium]
MQSNSVRALIAALIVVVPSSLRAESVAERKPWHAVIPPPRAGLPSVTIDLGYPGPYVPALNAPLVIRAAANDIPFDGYIGYHFAVGDRLTLDTPVIARARLRPHESWSFKTTATLRKCCIENIRVPREIAVEWRNNAMKLIASQSAGTPPWTSWDQDRLPLLVTDSASEIKAQDVLGSKPYVERQEALPDRAQWYAGFSAVVCPLAAWLDLPQGVREAIFGSGRPVVFFGFPRPGQKFTRLDLTLLPVSFDARPGSYDAPWPYRDSGQMPAAAPLSWIAREGSDKIGSNPNPYIVRTNAAAWGADAVAVTRPLPAVARVAPRSRRYVNFDELELETGDWPEPTRKYLLSIVAKHQFLSVYSSATVTVAAIVLAIVAWMLLRKTPRALVVVAIALTAIVVFAQRSRIRPSAAVRDYVIRAPIAVGIVDHVHVWRTYGATPFRETERTARTSITGDYGKREDAEVRTSETPASMGQLNHYRDWDAVSRWTYERELDPAERPRVTRAVATPSIADHHSPIFFWLFDRPDVNSGSSEIGADLMTQSDGRKSGAFAIPSDVQAAEIKAPFTANEVLITWATGSIKLKLVKKDIYKSATAEIPPDVLRQVAAQGGIMSVTFDRPVERQFGKVWIEMRESKS